MTSSSPPAITPALTEQQKLSFLLEATGDLDTAQVLQKNLPTALLNASADTLATLDTTVRELHAVQARVEADMSRLQPLNDFCAAALDTAMRARWSAVFDVRKDYLELPGSYCGCEAVTPSGGGAPVIPPATPTLLEAAMQNFTEDEAGDGHFPEASVIRIASKPAGVPGLTPSAFAGFCRELNLGQQYQQHFQQVFTGGKTDAEKAASAALSRNVTALKKQLLQLDLHLALIKKHITEEGFQTIRRLIDAGGVANAQNLRLRDKPLIMQGVELLDSCIWGVVVFSEHAVDLYPEQWCLVYMPGEPHQPLCEYKSYTDFQNYLELKLGGDSYKSYFTHCIGEVDKVEFFRKFADTGSLGHVRQLPISDSLFDFMFKSHVGKLQIDARSLAVPTADVDEEERKKRLMHYLEIGLTVANVAGFVVPVLGQLMMGVAIGQMLAEVYEGIEDWSRGDRQEAFSHLLSVAENIVLMVAVGAGIKGLKTLAIKTVKKHPEFFQPFMAILDRSGQPRLWKPELSVYERPLPSGAEPDASGLFKVGSQTFARVDNHYYAVTQNPVSKTWTIQHPARPHAYAPPLEVNSHGGWRHVAEQSEQWTGAYTLKRIDPRLVRYADSRLEMIRRLTNTRFDELHRLSDDGLPMPVRLQDMIERFGLERRVNDFVAAMERGEATDPRHVEEQLQALPRLANWPQDRYIKVVDENERIVETFPPGAIDDDTLSVIVSQAELEKGELLQTVIDGLYPTEVESLVGKDVPAAAAGGKLANVLGAAVKSDRRSTFDYLYRRLEQRLGDEESKLRSTFPDLPARYARDLIRQAPSVERLHLRTSGRVPMALAQKSRQTLREVRVDRALSGFYLTDIANADTRKLMLSLLPRLNGWDPDFYLEVRARTLDGEVLETLGTKSAGSSNVCTLVKNGSDYEVFDSDGKSLGQATSGPDGVYHAILKSLSLRQREALGFAESKPDDGWRLRSKLLDSALDEREGCAQVLEGGQFEPVASESFCTLADSPEDPATHSRRLLRKVKKLFPSFTDVQAREFLDQAGNDHLTRAIRVRQLQDDLGRLRNVLKTWVNDEVGMRALNAPLYEVFECRQHVAFDIEDCFRREVFLPDELYRPAYGLRLDGMRFGKLPALPSGLNFDHVRHLSLQNMLLDDDAAYFLNAFRNLETLELGRNNLTRLPEVVSLMPNLRRLGLSSNRIQLTDHSLLKLSRMRGLQSLDLGGNPLGATVNVSEMFDLTDLGLRNTRTTELPVGLHRLPNLDRLDLRDNDISELPQWLFDAPHRLTETINLRNNPLSESSRTLLDNYRTSVGVGMGFLENDIARLDEQRARSIWLIETGGTVGARRLQVWNAIKDDPMAEGLFHLLAELNNTADSQHVREDLSRRVWRVLEATENDSGLREQIFDLAANPINCADNAALNFSHLEVAVHVRNVLRVSAGRQPSASVLMRLAKDLFRLEQVDLIAAEHAEEQNSPDPLEVTLAYRTGLASALGLPGQPAHMRYAELADVTGEELATAIHRVQSAELSSRWLDFLVRQSFWTDYLKSSFSQQFDAALAPHQTEVQALFDKADELSSADYLSEMGRCAARKEQTENALLKRLTTQVIQQVERGSCVVPAD